MFCIDDLYPTMSETRKKEKKQRRKEALFLKKEPELGVVFQEKPSCHVLVANGGLENGIGREFLRHFLQPQHIHMPPGKDYAFIVFSTAQQAEVVVEQYNGVGIQSITDVKQFLPACVVSGPPLHLYLSYVQQLPPLVTTPPPSLPPGLLLVEEFITSVEEAELLAFLNSAHTDSHANLKHRQVVHYGYKFNYHTNTVDPSKPLPGGFPPLIRGVVDKMVSTGHVQCVPDQLTVNHYPPGAGIPPHVDTHSVFLEEIVSLSLGSQVVMDFREPSPDGLEVLQKVPVLLRGRSLLVMRGAARYLWSHGISTRQYDSVPTQQDGPHDGRVLSEHGGALTAVARGKRVSLTFRAVRQHPVVCTCDYPLHCDSQQHSMSIADSAGLS